MFNIYIYIRSKCLIKLKVENAFFFSENAEIFIKERQKKRWLTNTPAHPKLYSITTDVDTYLTTSYCTQ